MKNLLVISNHNPQNWSKNQLEGWDTINYIPLPNIDPYKEINELINEIKLIHHEIDKFVNSCITEGNTPYVYLQGGFDVCFKYIVVYSENSSITFTFPIIEHLEKKFEFIKWK